MSSFSTGVGLLHEVLKRRTAVVAQLEALLNCQKKGPDFQQDLTLQTRLFHGCFPAAGVPAEAATLNAWLEARRADDGLRPRAKPGNDLVDPVQMLLRGFHFWNQTRWPGQKGRLRYAHNLFNLFVVRCLALSTLRLWDEDAEGAGARLKELQLLLDALWQQSPADQPRLVRDVRWLIPVALSPTTDSLAGYFHFAERIAATLDEADRTEIQRAWVQTGAGHLCSQLRHLAVRKGSGVNDAELVLLTRKTNALDVCLLMEGLVTLFQAYAAALAANDDARRHELAVAICQAVSPDPELYLLRLDLLAPYTMIEELFVSTHEDGSASLSPLGERHLRLLAEYRTQLKALAPALLEDSRRCRPQAGAYAPYGALFGFSSNILELLAFKTLVQEPVPPYALEDAFSPGDASKRAWVNAWRQLPHVKPEVVAQYAYAEDFVDALHTRIEAALAQCVAGVSHSAGRLQLRAAAGSLPELPVRHVLASDPAWVAAGRAVLQDEGDLLHCRMEGEYLVSFRSEAGWVGISKDLLTEALGDGADVALSGLPAGPAAVLALMCPGLVAG